MGILVVSPFIYTVPKLSANSPYAIRQQTGGQLEFDEKGQQVVGQLPKTNRQQVVDEILHQAGDGLGAAIRQQPADGMKLFLIFAPINL